MAILMVDDKKYESTIKLNLREVMEKKGINRFNLSKNTNTKIDTINKLYFNNIYKVDLDVLARICSYLKCDINDILILETRQIHH